MTADLYPYHNSDSKFLLILPFASHAEMRVATKPTDKCNLTLLFIFSSLWC